LCHQCCLHWLWSVHPAAFSPPVSTLSWGTSSSSCQGSQLRWCLPECWPWLCWNWISWVALGLRSSWQGSSETEKWQL
jgi:hypothetical protein